MPLSFQKVVAVMTTRTTRTATTTTTTTTTTTLTLIDAITSTQRERKEKKTELFCFLRGFCCAGFVRGVCFPPSRNRPFRLFGIAVAIVTAVAVASHLKSLCIQQGQSFALKRGRTRSSWLMNESQTRYGQKADTHTERETRRCSGSRRDCCS